MSRASASTTGQGASSTAGSRLPCTARPGHIFNLGHGVFPSVDPDVLTRLAALVRESAVTNAVAMGVETA